MLDSRVVIGASAAGLLLGYLIGRTTKHQSQTKSEKSEPAKQDDNYDSLQREILALRSTHDSQSAQVLNLTREINQLREQLATRPVSRSDEVNSALLAQLQQLSEEAWARQTQQTFKAE
eukprot:c3147_g1_i1.p1 GENE.c3147_g1_i1~~c3147_g1_i1.p1  ORF type:complete len:119 (+),score=28.77 c3147_g1_i1:57-413(+)